MSNLVIVESPAKAKTIEKYLGSGYKVLASFGHVRDLPTGKMGIDIEHNFVPDYIVPIKSKKTIKALKDAAKGATTVLLASDPDREGEAIAWHIKEALKLKENNYKRIVFHEITKDAIIEAVKNPRKLDDNLVDAQQARRVLDRLVGYTLSPLLWRKVKKGLSAGRVQSVAVKLIVDREREINAFTPVEYWEIKALLEKRDSKEKFEAKLTKYKNKTITIPDKTSADKILSELKVNEYVIKKVETKDVKRSPASPFITSTLQQDATNKLRFSSKKTMMIAQQLYEGIEIGTEGSTGLITYMRTDSYNLSNQALNEIRNYIKNDIGDKYLPDKIRIFKKAKAAQEAHEAIRPTSIARTPNSLTDYLTKDQMRLYELIWKRTIACQMSDAVYSQIGIDILSGEYGLRTGGRTIKFDGFMKIYLEGEEEDKAEAKSETLIPKLTEGEFVKLNDLTSSQKFTEPPPRFTEASLIKTLEENGIGRPSTYAPTISTIQDRGYVRLENRKFYPEEISYIVIDLLRDHFPFVVSVDFTAQLETELDEIAEGKTKWTKTIKSFWDPFKLDLEKAKDTIEKIKIEKETNEVCEKCGKPMVIKLGRYGEFLACTGFPDCKNARPLPPKEMGLKCPECQIGDIVERRTRKGKKFWGCSTYPECKYATWNDPSKKQEKDE